MKYKTFFTMMITALAVSGCSGSPSKVSHTPQKALVVYFSWGGNTRIVAEIIKDITSADIFELIPAEQYTTDRKVIETQVQDEVQRGHQPPLLSLPDNLDEYDVIYVGSPCWFRTMAPPVATFMAKADLSGKTVVPFMTHGGNRMGNTVNDMKKLAPQAEFHDGMPVHEREVPASKEQIRKWLAEANLIDGK